MNGTAGFFYKEAMRLGYVARSAFKMQKQYNLIHPGGSVLDLGCAPGAWLQVACQHLGPLDKGGTVIGIDVKKVKVPTSYRDKRVRTVCADVMKLPKNQARELSPEVVSLEREVPKRVAKLFASIQKDKSRVLTSEGKGFSVILSDMCPNISSGITTKDAALSCELGIRALKLVLSKAKIPNVDSSCDVLVHELASCSDDNDDTVGILQLNGHLVIKLLESEDAQAFGKFCKSYFMKTSWLSPKATRSSSREIYMICQGVKREIGI